MTAPTSASQSASKRKLSPAVRKFLLGLLVVFLCAYLILGAMIWRSMHQSPEEFGHFIAKLPAPAVFLLYPFETLWTHARAGSLNIGDSAPDFTLNKVDKSGTVQLSAVTPKPVVLVFGSYT